MNTKNALAGLLAMAGMAGNLPAATVAVDWLQLGSGAGPSGFALRDDVGAATATGRLVVTSGVVFPGFPATRVVAGDFWSGGELQTEDSVAGDGSVSGFEVRVAPLGGNAAYVVELDVPVGRPLFLMAGELLWTAVGATNGVGIQAFSDAGPANVSLIEMMSGSDGVKNYNGVLSWNGLALETVAGVTGESRFAFFEISPLAGSGAKVVLSIPQAYNQDTGDSLLFALGVTPIPEPSALVFCSLGLLALSVRRR
jgi:hypothetical protein